MEGTTSTPDNDFCSVCQANCSHCSDCILQVWHHGSALQPCKCPLCRRVITLIVPTEASVLQQRQNPELAETLEKVERYNRLFRHHCLIQRMQGFTFLIRRLLRQMMDLRRTLSFVIRPHVYISLHSTQGIEVGIVFRVEDRP